MKQIWWKPCIFTILLFYLPRSVHRTCCSPVVSNEGRLWECCILLNEGQCTSDSSWIQATEEVCFSFVRCSLELNAIIHFDVSIIIRCDITYDAWLSQAAHVTISRRMDLVLHSFLVRHYDETNECTGLVGRFDLSGDRKNRNRRIPDYSVSGLAAVDYRKRQHVQHSPRR